MKAEKEIKAEQITVSEEIFSVIKEFDEVVELLQTAGDKISTLKKMFGSGEIYLGTAEEVMSTYYTKMERNIEQLIQFYKGSENYSVNAVSTILLMDKMLSGQYSMTFREN